MTILSTMLATLAVASTLTILTLTHPADAGPIPAKPAYAGMFR